MVLYYEPADISPWGGDGYWGDQIDGAIPPPVDNPAQDAFIDTFTGWFEQGAFDMAGTPGNSLGGLFLGIGAASSYSGGSGGTVTVGPIETVDVQTSEE